MEKMMSIKELNGLELPPLGSFPTSNKVSLGVSGAIDVLNSRGSFDGMLVETSKHKYYLLIGNTQNCCENWGYMISEDEPGAFIGSTLLDVRLTDTALNQQKIDEVFEFGFYEGDIQFVDFVTDAGVFQIAAYNEHNGYYGHQIVIIKDDEVWLNSII